MNEEGMNHLDIKPQNILIAFYGDPWEYICLTDFGTVLKKNELK